MNLIQLVEHHGIECLCVFWVLSVVVETLPKPSSSSTPFYLWVFRFSHALIGAIPRLLAVGGFSPKTAAMFDVTLQQPTDPDPSNPEQQPRP